MVIDPLELISMSVPALKVAALLDVDAESLRSFAVLEEIELREEIEDEELNETSETKLSF